MPDRHAAPPPPAIRTSRARLLGLLTALSTLGLLATNLYLPSLPGLAADFAVPAERIGLTLTIFLASLAVSQLAIGPLSDRYGRRPVLVAGLALYVASSLACALAGSLDMLLLWRVLQGLGACAGVVLVRAIARDLYEGAELTRAMAVIATLMASAPGFSPLVGGFIETLWGWRGNFWFVAAFAALCLALTLRWIGETNRAPAPSIALGAVGRAYLAVLGNPRFLGPALATAMALGALFAYFSASPHLIIDVLGFSPLAFGLLTGGTVFAVFAGGAAGPRLARRLGATRALCLGLALMTGGAMAMALLFQSGQVTLLSFLLPQLVFLLGLGIVNPVGTATALQPFPKMAGAASAMLGFLQMAGGTIGTLLLTVMPGGFPLSLPVTTGLLALIGLAGLLLCRALPAPLPAGATAPR